MNAKAGEKLIVIESDGIRQFDTDAVNLSKLGMSNPGQSKPELSNPGPSTPGLSNPGPSKPRLSKRSEEFNIFPKPLGKRSHAQQNAGGILERLRINSGTQHRIIGIHHNSNNIGVIAKIQITDPHDEIKEMKNAFDENSGLIKTIILNKNLGLQERHFGSQQSEALALLDPVCRIECFHPKFETVVKTIKTNRHGQNLNMNEILIPHALRSNNNIVDMLAVKYFPGQLEIYMKDAGCQLKDLIHDQDFKNFFKKNFVQFCCSLFETISFLESRNVSHRDIKLENICCRKNGDQFRPVLIDFGSVAVSLQKEEISSHTYEYLPPAVVLFILVKKVVKQSIDEKVRIRMPEPFPKMIKTVDNLKFQLMCQKNKSLTPEVEAFLEAYIVSTLGPKVELYDSDTNKNHFQRNECFKGILKRIPAPLGDQVAQDMHLSKDCSLTDYANIICSPAACQGLFLIEKSDCYSVALVILYLILRRHPIHEVNEYKPDDLSVQRLRVMIKITEMEPTYFEPLLKDVPEPVRTVLWNILCTSTRERCCAQDAYNYLQEYGSMPFSCKRTRLISDVRKPPAGLPHTSHGHLTSGHLETGQVRTQRVVEHTEDTPHDTQGIKYVDMFGVKLNKNLNPGSPYE